MLQRDGVENGRFAARRLAVERWTVRRRMGGIATGQSESLSLIADTADDGISEIEEPKLQTESSTSESITVLAALREVWRR